VLLGLRRAKSNVDRLKLVGRLPASLGVEIPTNGEPRTGMSMGEHAAVTAKKMGVKRVDQDELAAASHRNMAAAYDRGFFDDLVTGFLGLYRDNNLRPDSTAEKLAKLKPVFGGQLDATDRRRLGGPAVHRGVGGRTQATGAGLLRRRRDRRGRLRQR
jgi:acetyl-CoA C-acetyltransferase